MQITGLVQTVVPEAEADDIMVVLDEWGIGVHSQHHEILMVVVVVVISILV